MRRSLGFILAIMVVLAGAEALGSTAMAAPTVGTGSLDINITAPQGNQYLQTSYVLVTWEAYDPIHVIQNFLVYLDQDNPTYPRETSLTEMNITNLADGLHTIRVRGTNDFGDFAEDSVNFYIDTTPPTLRITSPANSDYLNKSDVTVSWQASSSVGIAKYEVRLDSNPWLTPIPFSQTSNTFSNLTNGQHNVTVVAYDWGSRTSTDVVTFNVDNTIPIVNITYPLDNAGFNHADITIIWSGSDAGNNLVGYQIWVDGVKLTTAVPTENHLATTFAQGYHTVRIVAIDIANSTASDEVTFLVDNVVPSLIKRSPQGSEVAIDSVVEVNFTKEMDPLVTTISVSGTSGNVEWIGTLLRYTPSTPLEYGTTYDVLLNSSDLVGNMITTSWSFSTTDMGIISGVVTDAEGKPLAGVSVVLDSGQTAVTNESGAFTLTAPAGPHNMTLTKLGWDTKIMPVEILAGQSVSLESMAINPANPLAAYGVIAAIAAVVIVLLIFLFRRRGEKKNSNSSRSWKGMEDLHRRSMRKGDDDDDDRL